jgi:hypothetical protein
MIKSKKLLIHFVFVVIAFSIIVRFAEATSMNFTVLAGEEKTETINLSVDDHVVIRFTIVGSLHFYITYPNGTKKDFETSDFHDSFICDKEGECVLRFSNVGSTEDKLVALDYEIEHYILGIPQMLFLVIIIVLICVAAVAVFILMGKPR